MTSQDAVTVAVRISAVWLLFRSIQAAANLVALVGGSTPSVIVASAFVFFVIVAAAAVVLLWVFAVRIAGLLLPRDRSTAEATQMSAQDFKQGAFSVLGLYLVATGIPSLGYWAAFVQRSIKVNADGFNPPIDMYAALVGDVVQVVVGLYLLLGSRGLVAMVRRLRGMPSEQGDKVQ